MVARGWRWGWDGELFCLIGAELWFGKMKISMEMDGVSSCTRM